VVITPDSTATTAVARNAGSRQWRISSVKPAHSTLEAKNSRSPSQARWARGLHDAVPADHDDAAQHDRSAQQMIAAQPLAQEQRGADRAHDGDGGGCDHRAVRQRCEAVAAGLQRRERRAAQHGEHDAAP
jgi:hypothetical protein